MMPVEARVAGADTVRVMICDDSVVMRAAIARAFEADPTIRIVARVADGKQALAEVRRQPIDVLVLDIEMPVMDGLTALPLLMRAAPRLRVLMVSTLTTRGAEVTLQALRLGAADYVAKPSAIAGQNAELFRRELLDRVRALASRPARPSGARTTAVVPARPRLGPAALPRLLAIGSSTGGPQALLALFAALGRTVPVPVIVTQHMPAAFTPILAQHITRAGGLPCAEAVDGEMLLSGRIYLAPGDRHLLIERDAAGARARLSTAPAVNFCRPSVDPMLESAAASFDGRVLVVMLTGMGSDGLEGTRRVIEAGGAAIAQDEASSVVWGMPGAVAQAGLCQAVLPLSAIAPRLREVLRIAAQ
ncbi:MAG TPA: chemotaxis response regulator protein-glutamate methylesterase [Acetobacteraceae bacterium]|nr:chemotaxis response regulator protein-glutamate methylesterase [Acetobacteraceae bacterium]